MAYTKWEYKCVSVPADPDAAETMLDRNGAQGWELVAITAYGMFVLKRPPAEKD